MLTFVAILLAFVAGMTTGAIGMLLLLILIARGCDAEAEWKAYIRKIY